MNKTNSMNVSDYQIIRQLFDDYLRMYSTRDDRLTTYFSEDFSGFTGGGDFLVKNREKWVAITRQDFAQVKDPIRIELKDLAIQSLSETIAVTTGFFTIHLPIKDHILSRETARLVLIFRKETSVWKISHSSISIPYHLVREGEIYPMKELLDRNQYLEKLVDERTNQLSEANDNLRQANEKLAREIAERMKSEEELKNSLSLLGASLESTADGILIVDRYGKIARWNMKFVEMWKIPEEVLTNHDDVKLMDSILSQLVAPDKFKDKVMKLYEQPEQSSFDQIDLLDDRVFERYSKPQRIEDTIVGRVWSFRDITERKRAEKEKGKLEAINRQFQKTESLSRMAGAIAHHFNNQIGVVIGGLEMTIEDLPRDGEIQRVLTDTMQAARKAVEVSKLMLTYLGQTTGVHGPLDLSETCRRSLPLLQAGVPTEVLLTANLPSPGPIINSNANQIQQVLANLVTNAWEASGKKHGAINLNVKTFLPADISAIHPFPINWKSQDLTYACLEVIDTGCGMADEDIEKIFDPFFSTKFHGRGLGLPTVLGIIKAHNGAVTVRSEIGRGSTFRVFLPVSKGTHPLRPGEKVQALVNEGGDTVLLVEDEEMVRKMTGTMLTRLGYKVLLAQDGVEAVEMFQRHKDEIHVVLSDLSMPRMNGWETLSALRRIRPDIPVILASGHDESKVIGDDQPARPQVFLHKPYQKAELREALAKAMKKD